MKIEPKKAIRSVLIFVALFVGNKLPVILIITSVEPNEFVKISNFPCWRLMSLTIVLWKKGFFLYFLDEKDEGLEDEGPDYPCQKCGKSDHPEWILLCDKCDNGWHASCLRPSLMLIPEGDWYCPPCQHVSCYYVVYPIIYYSRKEIYWKVKC